MKDYHTLQRIVRALEKLGIYERELKGFRACTARIVLSGIYERELKGIPGHS